MRIGAKRLFGKVSNPTVRSGENGHGRKLSAARSVRMPSMTDDRVRQYQERAEEIRACAEATSPNATIGWQRANGLTASAAAGTGASAHGDAVQVPEESDRRAAT